MKITKKHQQSFLTSDSSVINLFKCSGFTLIELMIVVAILAIIMSVAIPNYQAYGMRTKRSEAISNLLELSQWMERQFTIFGSYNDAGISALPFGQSPKQGTANYTLSIASASTITYNLTASPSGNQTADSCGSISVDQASRECILGGTICSDDPSASNRNQVRQCFTGK